MEAYLEFIANLARLAAARGWLRLGVLHVDIEPAAAQLCLIHNHVAHIYKLAYDEKFAKWSVGIRLTAWMVEHVMDRDDVHKLDYVTSDDPYKESWMGYSRR